VDLDTSTPSLEDCFSEQGLIDKVMESFESRKEQIGMAHAVQKALDEGQHLIAEAGTGIGKSLAYLLPCALWAVRNKKKVIVATSSNGGDRISGTAVESLCRIA